MSAPIQLSADPIRVGYVLIFLLAALACLVGAVRARRIVYPDIRRGLFALLVTSGTWAASMALYLVVSGGWIAYSSYLVGLVSSFATVGAWLYFTSAYTGRSLHRDRWVRTGAVLTFAIVVGVKLTNPWHGTYFTTEALTEPFPYLAIQHGPVHWATMAFAYALATVGLFMLFEHLLRVGHRSRPLVILVAITGLPSVLDVLATLDGPVLELPYAPLGVAAFAIGVLFLYVGRFERIHLAGPDAEPVIVLDADDRIHEFNRAAHRLLPALDGSHGRPLREVVPGIDPSDPERVIEIQTGGSTRYFRVSVNPYTAGTAVLGRAIVLGDVTESERYRRELERQNDRLEAFAGMVSHDLRNPLTVAQGYLEIIDERSDAEAVHHVQGALDRMETLIDDLLALARQGQPIDEPEPVSLVAVATDAWDGVDTTSAHLTIQEDLEFLADRDRLQQLFENLFRNAIDHVGEDVAVTVGPLDDRGFFVEDDGPGIPPEDRDRVFESGVSTRAGNTGFGLAIVREIANAHRWSIELTEGTAGGARFEFSAVRTPGDAHHR